MAEMKVASMAEFERLAETLKTLAQVNYLYQTNAKPRMFVLADNPDATAEQPYRFGELQLEPFMASGANPVVVVKRLIAQLAKTPGVRVVGFAAEGWKLKGSVPVDAPDSRQEVLLLSMQSAGRLALQALPLVRVGRKVSIGTAPIRFDVNQSAPN